MRKGKLIWLATILIGLWIGTAGATRATAQTASAPGSQTTQPARSGDSGADDGAVCNSRLLKALDALDRSEALIKTLQDQHVTDAKLIAKDDEIHAKDQKTIVDQDAVIKTYEKRKGTTVSFLFGLVKIRKY